MQKTSLGFAILTAVLVIIFLMQPLTQMGVVKANFYPFGIPIIQVHSPNTNPYISMKPIVNVSFDYQVAEDLTQVNYFSYNLDEKGSSMLTTSMSEFSYNTIKYIKYSVSTTLENLPNGNHTISIHANFLNGTISQILHLLIIVDTAYITPVPIMISPLNQTTYNTQQAPLIYTINANVLYSHYSLDAPDDLLINHWTSLTGNTTLANLSSGQHKLKLVVAIDVLAEPHLVKYVHTVYFTVDTNQIIPVLTPAPSPSSNNPVLIPDFLLNNAFLIVAVLSAFGIVIVILIAVFFKRRKKV